eukprot:CAMPEP_0179083664 /NCGR_PEP_ID=MMETSP0796-20121207/37793_1 /TAXON_ID=73915 /ORGANISM="Pyrodinium bahamense, Strain pbaha01" /LENGTH=77 /DNA_ID=CAMNT_0020781075 /DNA_START=253 /DNA_END=486 /DNA_ORIENTATION=-
MSNFLNRSSEGGAIVELEALESRRSTSPSLLNRCGSQDATAGRFFFANCFKASAASESRPFTVYLGAFDGPSTIRTP